MIAKCPKCAARYRIDREKLVEGTVRLRCSKCKAVFRVRAPEAPAEPPKPADASSPTVLAPLEPQQSAPPPPSVQVAAAPEMPASQEPTPRPVPAEASAPPPPAAAGPDPAEPPQPAGPAVLVAMPDAALAKQTGAALVARGFRAIIVHDGVEAILEIQRQLPIAVVMAAELPKMFGFQVCELVKRNESLEHIHVLLAGAIHHRDRYRRPPEEIYGADSYLEAPDLPDGIWQIFERAGIVGGAAPAPPPQASAPPQQAPVEMPAPEPAPAATAGAAPAPGLDDERAEAERLARIIVSDIILYNEDKFTQSIAAGNVAQALGPDLAEGRGLFEGRVDARVRGDRDYLMDELLRVARLRGME